uniref:Uncharacterized protein n=1 Tax=Meloidogyne enterolobii TaxID=390850 RepID=A0A6V7W514_MELEN|nr:unnamed protein product [Meloidogyne enterolobii]
MTEDELSNFDVELIPSQSDYLIKFQNNFNNLQMKYIEEKENSLNLEKKIFYLENKEKELNLKIKEIENNFLEEKKIIGDKNIFLENKLKEKKEKIQKIKSENKQKDEKINLLEEANDSFNKKIADLTIEMDKLKNIKSLNFIKNDAKWKIDLTCDIANYFYKCCENECINAINPISKCIEGNGFVNLINDENVNYIKCVEGKGVNNDSLIITENSFKKPENCINHSLFYFEIKCMKIERNLKDNKMFIGLEIRADHKYIRFGAANASIVNENNEGFNIPQFSWNNNDVFGCGLVYPPDDLPYIFFTQNGKQIGKAILLKDNKESYKPYVVLNCCSIETNFGKDLETKPFMYDISKYIIPKFY